MNKQEKKSQAVDVESLVKENEKLVQEVERLSARVDYLMEESSASEENVSAKKFPFGKGHLSIEEAGLLLDNLPMEISFIDKNDVFTYFNESVDVSEMMFPRTKEELGQSVFASHPSKSDGKVEALVRDIKAKKRDLENMWFKKRTTNQYVYVSFKGIFDENGEYLGIMEYVQDIQPFLELPSEMKVDFR